MSGSKQPVIAGVDTHADTHHAAVVDSVGRHLAWIRGSAVLVRRMIITDIGRG